MKVAVVEHSTPWRDFKGSLLLPGGALDKIRMAHHLQPHQPATDRRDPEEKKPGDLEKAKTAWSDPCPLTAGRSGTGGIRRLGRGKLQFHLCLPSANTVKSAVSYTNCENALELAA